MTEEAASGLTTSAETLGDKGKAETKPISSVSYADATYEIFHSFEVVPTSRRQDVTLQHLPGGNYKIEVNLENTQMVQFMRVQFDISMRIVRSTDVADSDAPRSLSVSTEKIPVSGNEADVFKVVEGEISRKTLVWEEEFCTPEDAVADLFLDLFSKQAFFVRPTLTIVLYKLAAEEAVALHQEEGQPEELQLSSVPKVASESSLTEAAKSEMLRSRSLSLSEPQAKPSAESNSSSTKSDSTTSVPPAPALSAPSRAVFVHTPAPSLKSGTLLKQGYYNRNWKERWFVLTQHHLLYYNTSQSPNPLGSIPLGGCHLEEDCGASFAWKIVHPKERTYFLAAQTKEEKDSWIKELERIGIFYKSGQPSPIRPPTKAQSTRMEKNSTDFKALPSSEQKSAPSSIITSLLSMTQASSSIPTERKHAASTSSQAAEPQAKKVSAAKANNESSRSKSEPKPPSAKPSSLSSPQSPKRHLKVVAFKYDIAVPRRGTYSECFNLPAGSYAVRAWRADRFHAPGRHFTCTMRAKTVKGELIKEVSFVFGRPVIVEHTEHLDISPAQTEEGPATVILHFSAHARLTTTPLSFEVVQRSEADDIDAENNFASHLDGTVILDAQKLNINISENRKFRYSLQAGKYYLGLKNDSSTRGEISASLLVENAGGKIIVKNDSLRLSKSSLPWRQHFQVRDCDAPAQLELIITNHYLYPVSFTAKIIRKPDPFAIPQVVRNISEQWENVVAFIAVLCFISVFADVVTFVFSIPLVDLHILQITVRDLCICYVVCYYFAYKEDLDARLRSTIQSYTKVSRDLEELDDKDGLDKLKKLRDLIREAETRKKAKRARKMDITNMEFES